MQFTVKREVSNIADSMLLPSRTIICELVGDEGRVIIEVEGEVNVEFEGNTYKDPTEFPMELTELFAKGRADSDPRVNIDSNNWFSIYFAKGNNVINSDIVNCENYSKNDLFNLCYDFYMYETDVDY